MKKKVLESQDLTDLVSCFKIVKIGSFNIRLASNECIYIETTDRIYNIDLSTNENILTSWNVRQDLNDITDPQ